MMRPYIGRHEPRPLPMTTDRAEIARRASERVQAAQATTYRGRREA